MSLKAWAELVGVKPVKPDPAVIGDHGLLGTPVADGSLHRTQKYRGHLRRIAHTNVPCPLSCPARCL